ncbi:unnamed protein product [Vitrella brassicaformis CCMP3155]|uniref:Uncharacterized protein n=2 Tax=Vitrella brassicaformis TaxID=1169539 RepID=A0A0G4H0U8_VITBC|nr:unnamed protein product [Vitrella brassicaformis CCMP3155]|eukprot:CEM37181.1 unnamed protein product [Vitrella brassicaformis CCMP3155]
MVLHHHSTTPSLDDIALNGHGYDGAVRALEAVWSDGVAPPTVPHCSDPATCLLYAEANVLAGLLRLDDRFLVVAKATYSKSVQLAKAWYEVASRHKRDLRRHMHDPPLDKIHQVQRICELVIGEASLLATCLEPSLFTSHRTPIQALRNLTRFVSALAKTLNHFDEAHRLTDHKAHPNPSAGRGGKLAASVESQSTAAPLSTSSPQGSPRGDSDTWNRVENDLIASSAFVKGMMNVIAWKTFSHLPEIIRLTIRTIMWPLRGGRSIPADCDVGKQLLNLALSRAAGRPHVLMGPYIAEKIVDEERRGVRRDGMLIESFPPMAKLILGFALQCRDGHYSKAAEMVEEYAAKTSGSVWQLLWGPERSGCAYFHTTNMLPLAQGIATPLFVARKWKAVRDILQPLDVVHAFTPHLVIALAMAGHDGKSETLRQQYLLVCNSISGEASWKKRLMQRMRDPCLAWLEVCYHTGHLTDIREPDLLTPIKQLLDDASSTAQRVSGDHTDWVICRFLQGVVGRKAFDLDRQRKQMDIGEHFGGLYGHPDTVKVDWLLPFTFYELAVVHRINRRFAAAIQALFNAHSASSNISCAALKTRIDHLISLERTYLRSAFSPPSRPTSVTFSAPSAPSHENDTPDPQQQVSPRVSAGLGIMSPRPRRRSPSPTHQGQKKRGGWCVQWRKRGGWCFRGSRNREGEAGGV